MPLPGKRLAAVLGMVILLLSCPACSTPFHAAGQDTQSPAAPAIHRPVAEATPASEQPAAPPTPQLLPAHTPDQLVLAGSTTSQSTGTTVRVDDLAQAASAPAWLGGTEEDPWDRLGNDLDLVEEDYKRYYSWPNLGAFALEIGAAAPLANTHADMDIRNWYQRKMRSETTDQFANFMTYAGQLWLVVPVGLEAAALAGKAGDDYSLDDGIYEWSNRSLRSIAVGAPPMLAMYVVLGASRPDRNDSSWHPFQDTHGVSGHTFMGAVPFLTAAEMTDNNFLKVPLVLGSFLTGWARLNNDRHFFSQIALGWGMAYLAVHDVDQNQQSRKAVSVVPLFDGGPGVGLRFQY